MQAPSTTNALGPLRGTTNYVDTLIAQGKVYVAKLVVPLVEN